MSSLIDSAEATGGKGGSLGASLTGAPSSGNLLVCGFAGDGITVSSITNGLTSLRTFSNGGVNGDFFYKLCDGTESATTTVTLSSAGAAWIWIAEFNGPAVAQSNTVNSGSGTAVTGGSDGDAATVLDILFVAIDAPSSTCVLPTPSGFSIDDTGTGGPCYGAMYDLDRGAANDPGCTLSTSASWAAIHATFEAAAAGLSIPVAMHHHRSMQQNQRGR